MSLTALYWISFGVSFIACACLMRYAIKKNHTITALHIFGALLVMFLPILNSVFALLATTFYIATMFVHDFLMKLQKIEVFNKKG